MRYVDSGPVMENIDEGDDGIQSGGDYTDSYTFDLAGNRITKAHDAIGSYGNPLSER